MGYFDVLLSILKYDDSVLIERPVRLPDRDYLFVLLHYVDVWSQPSVSFEQQKAIYFCSRLVVLNAKLVSKLE